MSYVIMGVLVLYGVLLGVETAIGIWVRKLTQRPAPR